MQALVDFLIAHGYSVVFLWVLAAQAGVPAPAIPLLLAAGAVAGQGLLDLRLLLLLSVLASVLSDAAWYALGRRFGVRVLAFLCRIAIEPDSCVRRTERTFAARGALTLLCAKFVPGVSTAAPPLAGLVRMPFRRFLWLDALGALLWSAAFLVPGWAFSRELERIAAHAALTGTWLLALFGAVVVLWILVRVVLRQRFLRRLRVARITPAELHRLQLDGAAPFVVDLRHAIDFDADPELVPGALRLTAEEVEDRHGEIPRDRDVVLYCT
jgi:membrane protein DedA with SNARE-associated domain